MITRLALGLAGVAATAYGGVLLLGEGFSNLVQVVLWLGVGVVLHDALLAPAVIVLFALPVGRWKGPLVAGLVVLGTLTVTAIPVLSGQGERPDNPTLLDRPYWTGWLVFVGLTAMGVVAARWLVERRGRQSS